MYRFFVKRLLDIILCSCALIVLSPVFLITAVAIKLSSPGPVMYQSDRTGIHHRSFRFYKFRSMHLTNADKGMFVADPDRVFLVGKIIRRLKIDELPQLINVIKGDMSIVGPRPMPYATVDTIYSGKYRKILSIRPGLTSAASLYDYVVGDSYSDDKKYRKEVLPVKLDLELLYLKRESFRYDAELVWRTIQTILQVVTGKKEFEDMPELKVIRRSNNK